ncbi:MAG: hypothetical protein A2007_00560 [Verrucomicrobia bacterium GWC2_42_7]|nr:MAG: hypothetical protein A2007_00560 [Verrucomicrobia bacterium GWC2_42_7]
MSLFFQFLGNLFSGRGEFSLSPEQNRKILIGRSIVFLWKVPKTFIFPQKERFPEGSTSSYLTP